METTATRNATLDDLIDLLGAQAARRHDIVAPATTLRYRDGGLVIKGAEAEITVDGVTTVDGRYAPTAHAEGQIFAALGIDTRYGRKLRASGRLDLLDGNVNGWLHGRTRRTAAGEVDVVHPADARSFLVRCLKPTKGGDVGVARAFLSDRYGIIDNIDALTAALDGVRRAGIDVDITGCDLTDTRMYVRVEAPQVAEYARDLLAGYRSPFTGESGDECPVVHAGFQIENSEVGGGAFAIVPRLVVRVCSNGMTRRVDAVRAVHLGGRLDDGVVRWSESTQRKQLDLITAKAADAVATFLDVDYMRSVIAEATRQAAHPVDAATVVERVGTHKAIGYTEAERAGILDHFVRGGQATAGGVFQAVTSYAQVIVDADRAAEVEGSAFEALALAARLG